MQFQYSTYTFPLIIAAMLSIGLAIYAWSRRAVNSGMALAGISLAIFEWCVTYALEISGGDLSTKVFWGKSAYIGIAALPLFWFIFAFNYYDNVTFGLLKW